MSKVVAFQVSMKRVSAFLLASLLLASFLGLYVLFAETMAGAQHHDSMNSLSCVSTCLAQALKDVGEVTMTPLLIFAALIFSILFVPRCAVRPVPIPIDTGPPDPRLSRSLVRRE
jgi:hypothetical protein